MVYQTKQRKHLMEFFEKNPEKHYTIEEIAKLTALDGEQISQATLYRNLSELIKSKLIRKFTVNGSIFYQFSPDRDCDKHIHLVCDGCNKMFHLPAKEAKKISKLLKKTIGFEVNVNEVTLYGTCKECNGGEE